MIRVPRDEAKRGGGGGGRGRANWLARSESGRGKNPTRPAKLRDEKKETKVVESSMSKLQLDDDTPTAILRMSIVQFALWTATTNICVPTGKVSHRARAAALKHQYPSHKEVEQFRARQGEMAEMSRARVERGEPSLLGDTSSDSSYDTSSDSSSDI
ncbi:hypothetical protein C1H46_038840 [Malus baccata]|uniref:Uncharacterized protein n=1 Tax=Malus baccata TaxID=106549 RepID=A0A540KNP5_MALBA|nr:hypothetical protein C1H46_038840 [Malus baccata]